MYITKAKNSLKGLFPQFTNRIWGIEWADIYFDGMRWRGINIRQPFYFKGRNVIGLNQKFIWDCWKNGISKLVIFIGEIPPYTEYLMPVPNKETIKWLEQQKHYEDRPSKFEGAKDMKIYYFRISNKN